MNKDLENEIRHIEDTDRLYIFGAGDVAREVYSCLSDVPYNKKIEAFIVSDIEAQAEKQLYGVPVISCSEAAKDCLVVVAVLEKYRDDILQTIDKLGITDIVCMTFESDLWCHMRKGWFVYHGIESGKSIKTLNEALRDVVPNPDMQCNFKVYVVKSPFDKVLKQMVTDCEWETDIQVGRALVNEQIADITDAEGDNISAKNKQYCELTALYWIWKHTDERYVGLSHYRRRFDISSYDIEKICSSDIDVIITTPEINVPSVRFMYEKNHPSDDWTVLENAVEQLCREYKDDIDRVAQGRMYIPYNMTIMRRDCLDRYCEWAFPIFEYIEANTPKRDDDAYQRRNVGFLAERAMTAYLLHHWDELKIVVCDKCFYE